VALSSQPTLKVFAGCCASANVTAARKRSVSSEKSFVFMGLSPSTAMGMPQEDAFENHISVLEKE
jgi:hypothetical protein